MLRQVCGIMTQYISSIIVSLTFNASHIFKLHLIRDTRHTPPFHSKSKEKATYFQEFPQTSLFQFIIHLNEQKTTII